MERYKILLVEDEGIIAMDTRHRLQALGHEVVGVVTDGESALAALRESVPDVVLMDIGLPGEIDGIEAAARAKELVDVPIVYLTAYEDDGTLARVKQSEPHGYLLKPSTDREIQIVIELAVYRHHAERERARLRDEIRRLEGIIPICASCKKMRSDSGYWHQVETYLAERTDAVFSHGICPDCLATEFPDSAFDDDPDGVDGPT